MKVLIRLARARKVLMHASAILKASRAKERTHIQGLARDHGKRRKKRKNILLLFSYASSLAAVFFYNVFYSKMFQKSWSSFDWVVPIPALSSWAVANLTTCWPLSCLYFPFFPFSVNTWNPLWPRHRAKLFDLPSIKHLKPQVFFFPASSEHTNHHYKHCSLVLVCV